MRLKPNRYIIEVKLIERHAGQPSTESDVDSFCTHELRRTPKNRIQFNTLICVMRAIGWMFDRPSELL